MTWTEVHHEWAWNFVNRKWLETQAQVHYDLTLFVSGPRILLDNRSQCLEKSAGGGGASPSKKNGWTVRVPIALFLREWAARGWSEEANAQISWEQDGLTTNYMYPGKNPLSWDLEGPPYVIGVSSVFPLSLSVCQQWVSLMFIYIWYIIL